MIFPAADEFRNRERAAQAFAWRDTDDPLRREAAARGRRGGWIHESPRWAAPRQSGNESVTAWDGSRLSPPEAAPGAPQLDHSRGAQGEPTATALTTPSTPLAGRIEQDPVGKFNSRVVERSPSPMGVSSSSAVEDSTEPHGWRHADAPAQTGRSAPNPSSGAYPSSGRAASVPENADSLPRVGDATWQDPWSAREVQPSSGAPRAAVATWETPPETPPETPRADLAASESRAQSPELVVQDQRRIEIEVRGNSEESAQRIAERVLELLREQDRELERLLDERLSRDLNREARHRAEQQLARDVALG